MPRVPLVYVNKTIVRSETFSISIFSNDDYFYLRFKYTTKFSVPKIACPAIVYAIAVVFIGPFFVCVSS